jgi:hypothetical protein
MKIEPDEFKHNHQRYEWVKSAYYDHHAHRYVGNLIREKAFVRFIQTILPVVISFVSGEDN